MKKRSLLLVTVLSLVLSGFGMARAGWFAAPRTSARAAARATQAHTSGRAFDPLNTEAAWRYRRGQSSNWRTISIYR
jgi:hypothetical protein